MAEDIETNAGVTVDATAETDSGYKSVLAGEGSEPSNSEPAVNSEEATKPLEEGTQPSGEQQTAEDPEVVLEIGGKEFVMKQSEALKVLENQAQYAEREKALTEKEKSMQRDYTRKTQELAGIRKSFESSFGRVPEMQEINALGKVYQAYMANPKVAEVIDSIISGKFVDGVSPARYGSGDAYTQNLESQIRMLEQKVEGFVSSSQEERAMQVEAEAVGKVQGWIAKQAEKGVQITEEIDAAMEPFVAAIRRAHPDWEAHRILDQAYRHATIDNIQSDTAKKVLKSADEAKKTGQIRITPRTPIKSDSDKSYREMVLEHKS